VTQLVKKAVIPAAGSGTRLKPLTKYNPKELLPVGDKPILQHVVEMYLASGISQFCVITSPKKTLLQDFLTGSWHPNALPYQRDHSFYERLKNCQLFFCTQKEPYGVADAIALAEDFVGAEPFACIMPDCLLFSERPFLGQLLETFSKYRKNTIGTVLIDHLESKRYGNVGVLQATPLDDQCFSIESLSNKTRSPLKIPRGRRVQKGFGGGIYLPGYFGLIDVIRPSVEGEIDDVPIHHILIRENNLLGVPLQGEPFDTGHLLGYRAAVRFAGRPN